MNLKKINFYIVNVIDNVYVYELFKEIKILLRIS
jgi:hypothetical protein